MTPTSPELTLPEATLPKATWPEASPVPGVVGGPRGDRAVFWRLPRHDGLACLSATFRRHAYARHTHETYAVAAILAGCETFHHRGAQHYAGAGCVAVVAPDEVHDGAPHGGGFEYRTFYPSADLMRAVAEEVAGRPLPGPPRFPASVIHDPELAGALARMHDALDLEAGASALEQDSRIVAVLARLVARWSDLGAPARAPSPAPGVAQVRAYLDAHHERVVTLPDLARIAGLSRAHLIRAFQRETGLSPHAYLVDRRVRAACGRLAAGEPPGAVAASCGFCDQSHLARAFKARMGVTPGAYRTA